MNGVKKGKIDCNFLESSYNREIFLFFILIWFGKLMVSVKFYCNWFVVSVFWFWD